jgi:hypothetical protein
MLDFFSFLNQRAEFPATFIGRDFGGASDVMLSEPEQGEYDWSSLIFGTLLKKESFGGHFPAVFFYCCKIEL